MADDIAEKRKAIKEVYPWPRWEARVDKMSDKQVLATYFRLRAAGKL